MSLILTTPTNPGIASWTNATGIITASAFVYDPTAVVESGNIFNNLDSLAAAVATVNGPKVVQFVIPDVLQPLPGGVDGYVVANGTNGPYDFSECAFVTTVGALGNYGAAIDFAAGVVFSGMPYKFSGYGAIWRFPAGFWTATKVYNAITLEGAQFYSQPALVGSGCFTVPDNILLFMFVSGLGAVSGWGDAPATKGLFDIAALGYVGTTLYDQGQVGLKCASGAGAFTVTMGDANCSCENQTLLTGSFTLNSNEHGTIVYDTTVSSYNFIYRSWAVLYGVARNSGLNRDQVIHVNGTTGTIPAGTWDLSNIIFTGNPGSILEIQNGANLSSTTQLRVRGGLTLRVAAGVLTSPFVWTSGTRTVQIDDSATIINNAAVPFIAISDAVNLRITGSGSRFVPMASISTFLTMGNTSIVDVSSTRTIQSAIALTANSVGFEATQELQQKGVSSPAPAVVYLADGAATPNAYVRIPQYSTVILQGTITARGVTTGTVDSGTWTFATMVTRDGAGSTITAGAAATAVSAVNYATAPTWVLDAGSGSVRLQCTGANAATSKWTVNMTITVVGTGA